MTWRDLAPADILAELRAFRATQVDPVAAVLDERDEYPVDLVAQVAARGWNAASLPVQYGGLGWSMELTTALFEEMSVSSAILGISLITNFQSQQVLLNFGDSSLKDAWLPRYAEGLIASYALTERSRGSDIRSLDTKATRCGDGWEINGQKAFITSGSAAQLFLVLAETPVGVSVFAIPRDAEGVSTELTREAQTFGLRNGPHVDLNLTGVRLPADHLVGVEGRGLSHVMHVLARSRTLAAAISLGIARAAFDGALNWARERTAFDQRVTDFQGIQWYFASASAKLSAARLLTYAAARDLDSGRDVARSSSEAKLLAGRTATEITEMAVQVCGAHGTRVSSPFGRYLRDAKAYEVAGGSNEVLKNTIAKRLLAAAAE